MENVDTARLIYLVVLGGALAGYALMASRGNLGQMARHAILWALIFIGVIAGYGLWQDMGLEFGGKQAIVADEGRVVVPQSRDGHYYLTLEADGVPIEFIVDTGATDIVLTREDASRIGIDPDSLFYTGVAQTANGTVRSARAKVEQFDLGGIVDRNVTVWINEGDLFASLLGMAYLQRFSKIEIENGRLVLVR